MSEIENAFTLFFWLVLLFFFYTLLSVHLNDVQIFSDLQLDVRLIYMALTLILWLSSSEDCYSKTDSYLSPTGWLSDICGRWKNTVARLSWLLCLSSPAPIYGLFLSGLKIPAHPQSPISTPDVLLNAEKGRQQWQKEQHAQSRIHSHSSQTSHCILILPS